MPTLVKQSLDQEFCRQYWIDEILNFFEGSQKKVFIVKIWENKQVIKFFKNFWKRDKREHEIYNQFKEVDWLPKVIKIIEIDDEEIIFEEHIDGCTLEDKKEQYADNGDLIIDLMRNIIQILTPLRNAGIIHRDLAPKNILIEKSWKPFVIDFWIARDMNASSLTETGFQPHTPFFASPAQLQWNKKLMWYRSDFFSLGVISYYLYYGVLPFGNNIENIRDNIKLGKLSYNSSKDCELNKFFNWTLHQDPSMRPRNPSLLLNLLS